MISEMLSFDPDPELEKPLFLKYPMEWSKMLSFGPDLRT